MDELEKLQVTAGLLDMGVPGRTRHPALRFLELSHTVEVNGPILTIATSKVSGSRWTTWKFSLEWASSLPICSSCGKDLIEGEARVCSPCEAEEIMPLIRAFQVPLKFSKERLDEPVVEGT